MEIVVIAYVLTGVRKVVKIFRLPFHDRPAYARAVTAGIADVRRRRRGYGMIFLMVLGWAPVDVGLVLSGLWRDPDTRRETISNFLTFVVLVALGFAFL